MNNKKYAVIDVETTGGRANRDRITEIAIVVYDGHQIIDRFESLINPERTIPYNITQLTGITQEMVEEAPKFYEVARQIVEMTKSCIFVAHNARFDYNFIREEFKRLGYTFSRRLLCTVRLSRKTYPSLRSHSLANLIRHFNIDVSARHRAMADAMATVDLLGRMLSKEASEETVNDFVNLGIKESQLPENISLDQLHDLPEECGVYYFYDLNGDIIYIGKSINIKKRVMQHFGNKKSKGDKLQQSVNDISFEITGSELVALLQESHEIKHHHPRINRAQRVRQFQYVLHAYKNKEGYICIDIAKASKQKKKDLHVLHEYPSLMSAKAGLQRIMETFELCERLCNFNNVSKPCFYYHLHKCHGACVGKEAPEDYNERVQQASGFLEQDFEANFLIIDKGRSTEEQSVVLVEDGRYRGFGYVDINTPISDVEELRDAIKTYRHTADTARIIRSFLEDEIKKGLKIIRF
ncbi:MAG: exonuclease domain-containing protein [Bacteroidota bacterium]